MNEKNPKSLIKSRSRVQEFGEVFTSEKEVENIKIINKVIIFLLSINYCFL